MKPTILTTIFILLLPLGVSAQLKVGMMSPGEVLEAMPETAQIQTELEQYVQERQTDFQTRYQNWIEEITEYNERAEAGLLSESEQAGEEERLAEQQQELENLRNRIQQEIRQREANLFNPLLQRVEVAMDEVAAEMDLEMVLNKETSIGDPIIYFASQRAPDITQRVIEKLAQN